MSSVPDSDELKAKYAEIAALKKAIDEKKAAQNSPYGANNQQYQNAADIHRGGYRGGHRGSYRGGYRGGFRGHPFYARGYGGNSRGNVHRNMSVVFNSNNTNEKNTENTSNDDSSTEPTYVSSVSKSGMSLVNSDVYEKDKIKIIQRSENAKQIQDQLKQRKIDNAIKARVLKNKTKTDNCDRVKADGDEFAVTHNGDELVLLTIPTGGNSKTTQWNSKIYSRESNGNLKCQSPSRGRTPSDQCRYFTRTGLCQKGSNCKYRHDRNYIKLCRQYLSNTCQNKNCLLSHTPSQYNTPLCRYYLENKCANPQCQYEHTRPKHYDDPKFEIWVCRPFAIGGSCSRGRKCPFLHLFICPVFQENGSCPKGKACTLAHPITRSTQRSMLSEENDVPNESEVIIESDSEHADSSPQIINSYTVDPNLLFESSRDGKYDIYIDNEGSHSRKEGTPSTKSDQNTFQQNSEFMIHLDSDSESERNNTGDSSDNDELDDLEENNDYVDLATN